MTRTPLFLAAIAGALTLAACGGSDGTMGAAARDDKALDGALKYAKCMREHGVDMPDPVRDANGGIRITARSRAGATAAGKEDPKMKAAQDACGKFMEAGGGAPRDPAAEARMQDALFAYAKCMRGKGIDMPDPQVSGGKVLMKVGGPGEKGTAGAGPEDSPKFKPADKACHPLLAEVEKDAVKERGK
jgi:hypothetical protein